jgi:hypothetical protein
LLKIWSKLLEITRIWFPHIFFGELPFSRRFRATADEAMSPATSSPGVDTGPTDGNTKPGGKVWTLDAEDWLRSAKVAEFLSP